MRTRINVDSATPQEVYNLTLAFQRTRGFPMPEQLTTEPTVTVSGTAMGWVSPSLRSEHAIAILREFGALNASDAQED